MAKVVSESENKSFLGNNANVIKCHLVISSSDSSEYQFDGILIHIITVNMGCCEMKRPARMFRVHRLSAL